MSEFPAEMISFIAEGTGFTALVRGLPSPSNEFPFPGNWFTAPSNRFIRGLNSLDSRHNQFLSAANQFNGRHSGRTKTGSQLYAEWNWFNRTLNWFIPPMNGRGGEWISRFDAAHEDAGGRSPPGETTVTIAGRCRRNRRNAVSVQRHQVERYFFRHT